MPEPIKWKWVTDFEWEYKGKPDGKYNGWLVDNLFVFKRVGAPGYALYHHPTGMPIVRVETEVDIKKIATVIMSNAPAAMATLPTHGNHHKTIELLEKRAPHWIRYWLRECRSKSAFVDPKPYKEGHYDADEGDAREEDSVTDESDDEPAPVVTKPFALRPAQTTMGKLPTVRARGKT